MTRLVEVHTSGRLHFGLNRFGGSGRQFGGLGLMVNGVGVALQVSAAETFQISGPLSERVEKFAQRVADYHHLQSLPACQIEVLSCSSEHTGLGIGTQLGLAVAAGLSEWSGLPWRDASQLAQMSGRGRRSAIGTHGFLHGGLLVDGGKLPGETIGELQQRVEFPVPWNVVLVRRLQSQGMAGSEENQAIDSLPEVSPEIADRLQGLINRSILPAVRDTNFQQFCEAIYEYGYLAGECFASVQDGPFATPEIELLVNSIRSLGYAGVGQSSWGPTVFAFAENELAANSLVDQLRRQANDQSYEFKITQANNSSALVRVSS